MKRQATEPNTLDVDKFVPKVVTEKPHPMRKVPGFPRTAEWDRYLGRWVIYRDVTVADKRAREIRKAVFGK